MMSKDLENKVDDINMMEILPEFVIEMAAENKEILNIVQK
jgi:hypothetical protein